MNKFAHWLAKHRNLGLEEWMLEVAISRQYELDNGIISAENPTELDSAVDRHIRFPLAAALLLNRNQQYAAAHDWYRLLYDPETGNVAEIFTFYSHDISREHIGAEWLDEPLDPVAIANRRQGVWLRHTILAMVRNLIDWADDEFARGLPDTFQRAEELYELARRTLQAPPLQNKCEKVLLDVVNVIQDELDGYTIAMADSMVGPLKAVSSADLISKAGKDIRKALSGRGSVPKKRLAVKRIIARTVKADHRQYPDGSLAAGFARRQTLAIAIENAIFFQSVPDGGSGGKGRGPFPKGSDPFLPDDPIFPPPDRPFDGVIDPTNPKKDYTPPPSALFFCIPPNPVLRSLQLHIDTQLRKLQLCLDFMGEPQLPRVYGCDTYDAATGLINRPTATLDQYNYCVDQPRYRYSFLIEKAHDYVDVAQRIGSILLQALQNSDNEAFLQLKAQHAIELAGATIELRRLARQEAVDGVEIAEVQKDRADSQVGFWEGRAGDDIDNTWDSMSDAEQAGLVLSGVATALSGLAILPGAAAAGAGAAITASGVATTATGALAEVGIPMTVVGFVVTAAGLASLAASLPFAAAAAGSASSTALTYASFERRFEEWKNQFELAGFDARLADLQVTVAGDRLAIAGQELEIALLELSHAREELRFLQTKVTSAALYDWMVRVLSRDYRVLMQIAACVARMAQRALEFERQESVRIVTGDYWNIAQGALASKTLTDEQRSLGLLGAERLLTDLTKLDAFKLATEKRRLQISKTFSLARRMPIEMVKFRDSGRITFNTLLDWFDDGFQGHYLRLIKSVRVSMFAIVPPLDGIHAMLHNTGESSVVVLENGNYVEKRAARNFGESIALDSAFNESGLFVLNYEDPMLLPFEGLGVQTQWTLELPRGNNRFNLDTIADVFLTIEYTAEYSRQLEQDMRNERIDQMVYEDTAVPLRLQFPDLWYHLKNHREDATGAFPPFQFKFDLPRTAFAPNLADPMTVAHLTMLVSGDFELSQDQQTMENGLTIKKGAVRLHSPSAKAFGPGVTDSNSLMLSTRGAGATGLSTHPTIPESQEWTLEFAPDFFNPTWTIPIPLIERIADVLLVITVKGTRA